ncbi:MAG: PD40 domain-containing protein [Sandaracinus sp.]|nr:PD40 domain-containing protein [Sandaracinus sp.]
MRSCVSWLLRVLVGLLLVSAATSSAQTPRDRRVRWRTVETEHFAVHYPEPLGHLARRIAFVAENTHANLREILDHEPRERVHIALTDDSDSANGSATTLPYTQMALFAAAPEDIGALGDYDDWFHLLVTHEHTHVLHLDTIGGLPRFLNRLLGKTFAPNLVQPRWFIEGLATHEESRQSAGGRLRSTLFSAYLRMDALEGRMLRMDELSSSVDRWPRGNTWYLYGSRFVDWIANEHGREALTAISHEYGRRLIPFAVNRTARRVTGRTFVELYADWQADVRADAEAVRARVEAEGRVEGSRLTWHGETCRSPRFLPDGSVVYSVVDGHRDGGLRRVFLDDRAPVDLVRTLGESYVQPIENGRALLYDAIDAHRDIYFFNDLHRLDVATGEVTRLTDGRRAQQPELAPDGRRLAFTQNGAGTTHLMIADLQDVEASARVLRRSRRYEQVFTPRWSPDGTQIAVSLWSPGGYRDIALVDARTGDTRRLTNDRAMDTSPAFSPDGRYLFFSSDRSGIANLYAIELSTGRELQVTNVLGGAWSPDVSADGRRLVYLGYTSRGFDLWTLELDPSRWRDATPYVDDRPPPTEVGETALLSTRYRSWQTLYPRNYLIDVTPDGFGQQLGFTIASNDIVGLHAYSARLGISLAEGYLNGDVSWRFGRNPAPITLRAFRTVAPRGGLRVGGEDRTWHEEALGADVGIAYGMSRMLHSESFSASYSISRLRPVRPFGGELDPTTAPPQLPETGRFATLRVGWGYSDVRRRTYDMFATAGRSLGLSVSVSHPTIGSQFRVATLSGSWSRFVTLAPHHVLAMRLGGGISGGDFGRRGVFGVGGFPNVSLVDGLIDQITMGGAALRGYAPFVRTGTRFSLAQLEYRFPIGRLMRGYETVPVYLNRAYGVVYVDAGDAWNGRPDASRVLVGAGGELLLDFTLGYTIAFTFRVGFGYGFMDLGGPQVYAHFGVPF